MLGRLAGDSRGELRGPGAILVSSGGGAGGRICRFGEQEACGLGGELRRTIAAPVYHSGGAAADGTRRERTRPARSRVRALRCGSGWKVGRFEQLPAVSDRRRLQGPSPGTGCAPSSGFHRPRLLSVFFCSGSSGVCTDRRRQHSNGITGRLRTVLRGRGVCPPEPTRRSACPPLEASAGGEPRGSRGSRGFIHRVADGAVHQYIGRASHPRRLPERGGRVGRGKEVRGRCIAGECAAFGGVS
mmetsp:Transcript_21490/g.52921  ORF Transcript_21490/g.52921 Transcript_21490/m.52921 type:complete len:243 (-) Transcript_21490:878-1606(-)